MKQNVKNVDRELVDDGRMHSCSGHCAGCPLWAQHHPDEVEEVQSETSAPVTFTISKGSMGVYFTAAEMDYQAPPVISYVDYPFPELPAYVIDQGTSSIKFGPTSEE